MKTTPWQTIEWTVLLCLTCACSFCMMGSPGNTKDYFASSGATTWVEARRECVRMLKEGGGLVAIETEKENNFLNEFLDTHGSGGEFWTGGAFDPEIENFRWESTEAPITLDGWSYNPWAPGEPPRSSMTHTRTLFSHTNRSYSEWSTDSSTGNHRYICEADVRNNNPPGACLTPVDLDILIDSAHTKENFQTLLQFTARLTTVFTANENSRIGVLRFGDQVSRVLPIDNGMTPQQIQDTIIGLGESFAPGSIPNQLSSALISSGMELMDKGREGVRRKVLVITASKSDIKQTDIAVKTLRASGITTYSVGVGDASIEDELYVIAIGVKRAFRVDRWDNIFELISISSDTICYR